MKHLEVTIHWLPIVVADLAVFLFGGFWYSGMWGRQILAAAMQERGGKHDGQAAMNHKGGFLFYFLLDFIVMFLQGYGISLFMAYFRVSSLMEAVQFGSTCALVTLPLSLNHNHWEDRPLSATLIHTSKIWICFVLSALLFQSWGSYTVTEVPVAASARLIK